MEAPKTNKDVVLELVDILVDLIDGEKNFMLTPAVNIVKLKLCNLDDEQANTIVDGVHRISHHIEKETGRLSPYHGIEVAAPNALVPTITNE